MTQFRNKLKKAILPAIILTLLISSEYIMDWCPQVFREIIYDDGSKTIVTWGDVLYHMLVKIAIGLPFIALYRFSIEKAEKLIYLSLILWFVKDLVDRLHYIAEHQIEWIQHNLFWSITENDIGFIFQVTLSILVLIFGIIASIQCTLFYRLLALFSWPFWYQSVCSGKESKKK